MRGRSERQGQHRKGRMRGKRRWRDLVDKNYSFKVKRKAIKVQLKVDFPEEHVDSLLA